MIIDHHPMKIQLFLQYLRQNSEVPPGSTSPRPSPEKEGVARINPTEHKVHMAGGRIIPFDRLLVATGATASRPDTPGINLEGVVTLDSMEDTLHIMKLARRSSSAVVIGGGITALELVEAFTALGVKTHYFLRGDRYWNSVLDETESEIVQERLEEEGVILHFSTRATEILGKKNKVEGVRTDDGKVLACQMVGIAIGIKPRKELQNLIRQRNRLKRQVTSIASARRLLAVWHAIHIPLGLTLFAMAFVHVIGAIYYAGIIK
jgi:NADPH-dependent 2,4-dienoyl-CoA reductase/sulfur reductase-like enzyme